MAALSSLVAMAVSGVFAVALLRRWASRGRTPAALWWGLALVQFCIASAALLGGEVFGWNAGIFRVFYLFGAVTNVLWLGLGTIVINARRRWPTVVTGAVILAAGLLSIRGTSGQDPDLWWSSVVLGTVLGAVLLLPSARWVQHAALAVVVVFSVAAAFAVLSADLVAALPRGELPEGRELFPVAVRGMAVAGNSIGSVIVVVGALASSAHAVWRRPDRTADAGLRDVRFADRSIAAALADWIFAGRRGTTKAGNVVRGNLLIAAGVALAAMSAVFAYLGSFLSGLIGVELADAETTGHAVGLAIGVVVMYRGFLRTLQPMSTRKGVAEVLVYTRRNCGLCHQAEQLVARYAPATADVTHVDIDADDDLLRRYHLRVPVVEVDGIEVAEAPIDPARLRIALQGRRRRFGRGGTPS